MSKFVLLRVLFRLYELVKDRFVLCQHSCRFYLHDDNKYTQKNWNHEENKGTIKLFDFFIHSISLSLCTQVIEIWNNLFAWYSFSCQNETTVSTSVAFVPAWTDSNPSATCFW